ncbi:MAG: cadherin-like domain-containing protein [Planctomycetes bacterium]|nr:cadherin-like domain-containing protein [Planctomycetota bacterium]
MQNRQCFISRRGMYTLLVILIVGRNAASPPDLFAAESDIEDTSVDTMVVIDVLANDFDGIPLDPTTVEVTIAAPNGVAVVNPNGTVNYTPDAGFSGWDWFDYSVTDELDYVNHSFAVIYVVPGNAPPARDDEVYAYVDELIFIDVLANDGDLITPLDPWMVFEVGIGLGTVIGSEIPGAFEFLPPEGFLGDVTFRYSMADENGVESNFATVTVHVVDNKPPVIVGFDSIQVAPDEWHFFGTVVDEAPDGLLITFGGILAGDTATTAFDGTFSIAKIIPPFGGGIATAQTIDEIFLPSLVVDTYVDQ